MDFNRLKKTVIGTQNQNRWLWVLVLVLGMGNITLAISVFSTETIMTIRPPGLTAEAKISRYEANEPYHKAWGLFIAEMLGNIKPGREDFILKTMKPLLAPSIYREVTTSIQEQARIINRDHITSSFTAKNVSYVPKTNTVYVTGREISKGPGSDPVRNRRTYEMTINIQNYRPLLQALDAYDGEPDKEDN